MKKVILAILIVLVTFLPTLSFAKPCPLPDANTDAEILFSGFKWYTDMPTTLNDARANGIIASPYIGDFSRTSTSTYHWPHLYSDYYGREPGCGVFIAFVNSKGSGKTVPDVAGYPVNMLWLYFLRNINKIDAQDPHEADAVKFYMAEYELNVQDIDAAYDDLVSKLKSKYGNNPLSATYASSTHYTCWVNKDGALVGVKKHEKIPNKITLLYMAPGAEENLVQVEQAVKDNEAASVKNDTTGL